MGGVGVILVGVLRGEGGGDSNTGRSAFPGTGLQTPLLSYPEEGEIYLSTCRILKILST